MTKKILTVIGATGAQGGGLVDSVLNNPTSPFTVRAVTRDPSSAASRALKLRGAEVVRAELGDEASLRVAFAGAEAAFLVTSWGLLMSAEAEIAHAHSMARAAKAAGVGHVVWSTFEDSRKWIGDDDSYPTVLERYKIAHVEAKAEADAYFTEIGLPTTFLRTSFFWENLNTFMPLTSDGDGELILSLAMGQSKLAGIAVADIGAAAHAILSDKDRFAGNTVSIAGEHLTGAEMARTLSDVLGRPVTYQAAPVESLRALDIPLADDHANMFQFYTEYADQVTAARNPAVLRSLVPDAQTFRGWAERNREALIPRT